MLRSSSSRTGSPAPDSPRALRVALTGARKDRRLRIPESPLFRRRPFASAVRAASPRVHVVSPVDDVDATPKVLSDFVRENRSRDVLAHLSALVPIERREAVLQKDADGNSLLHVACAAGAAECVAVILGAAAAALVAPSTLVFARNKTGDAPVHCAASGGHVRAMLLALKAMVAAQANGEAPVPESDGTSNGRPSHSAPASSSSPGQASAQAEGPVFVPCHLHARSADAHACFRTSAGTTVLHVAANAGQVDVVDELLTLPESIAAFVACVHCRAGVKKETALHCAARAGSSDCASLLVSAGAAVDVVDALGRTPALVALRHEAIDCVELLATCDPSSPLAPHSSAVPSQAPSVTSSASNASTSTVRFTYPALCDDCGAVGCCAWLHEREGALALDVDAGNRMRALFQCHDAGHTACAEFIFSRANACDKRLLACAWLLKSRGVPVGDLKVIARRTHSRSRANSLTRVADGKEPLAASEATEHLAFHVVMSASWEQLAGGVTVQFDSEAGKGPGVNREWMRVAWEELADDATGLLSTRDGGHTYHPRCEAEAQGGTVRVGGARVTREWAFRLMGRLVGLSFVHEIQLPLRLSRPLLRYLAGVDEVDPEDTAEFDAAFHRTVVRYVAENDVTDLELTFTDVETWRDECGRSRVREIELCEGGADMAVTEANKREYIRLLCAARVFRGVERALTCMREGFHDIVPVALEPLGAVFSSDSGTSALDIILSGLPTIDMADWRRNTVLGEGFDTDSPQVQWLWDAVARMDARGHAALLRFVTGSPSVPFGGFGALRGLQGPQPFEVQAANGTDATLPSAATCFNRLYLPRYSSASILEAKLRTAVEYGGAGFVFV